MIHIFKIIDETFNYKNENIPTEVNKYLHMNIFTKNFEDAPNIKFIGDIIYLKRFKV